MFFAGPICRGALCEASCEATTELGLTALPHSTSHHSMETQTHRRRAPQALPRLLRTSQLPFGKGRRSTHCYQGGRAHVARACQPTSHSVILFSKLINLL